jgi:hypothetical protein
MPKPLNGGLGGTPGFPAARRCSSAIREGNTIRARGFHKSGSNLSYFRAVRR